MSGVDLLAGAAEDDRRGGRLDVEDAAEGGGLVRPRDDVGGLADPRRLAGLGLLPADGIRTGSCRCRRARESSRRRHRGREQDGLPGLRRLVEDRLEVLGEAHVEHLVGLVEHDGGDLVQPQAAAVEQVQRPAGRRDDDVDARLQGPQLAARSAAPP